MRGITFIEAIIVLAILSLMVAGAFASISSLRSTEIDVAVDGIVLTLEEARSDAISGVRGDSHGVNVSAHSYARFSGETYDPDDEYTEVYQTASDITLEASFGGDAYVVFARVSGKPSVTGTITVRETSDASNSRTIQIGEQGDVSVIE